jgi:hypothetical protein
MRQIAGAFSQLEKARLVAKLKAARDRKREANGKCEGRKSYIVIVGFSQIVAVGGGNPHAELDQDRRNWRPAGYPIARSLPS